MRYIVFAYNMPTLCRTIQYINTEWGKENTTIIYADLVSSIPERIKQDYTVETIDTGSLDKTKRGFSLIFGSCSSAIRAWKVLDNLTENMNEQLTFVVFRDNEIQEATMIEKICKKYKQKVNIWIIEEGSGIYALKRVPARYRAIKKVIYSITGVSTYSLECIPQGLNPHVEKVICGHPELLAEKFDRDAIQITKMIPIFTPELNEYIINSVLGNKRGNKKYDYVFLTQPITDFRRNYNELIDTHNKLLPIIFDKLSEKGQTIIKLHPREHFNYAPYVNERIDISQEDVQLLPFECLMQLYGNPQMISMFSSISLTIKNEKPSIYLCGIFEIPATDSLYSEAHYKKNNIIVCDSIKNFSDSLVSSRRDK